MIRRDVCLPPKTGKQAARKLKEQKLS